MSTVAPSLTTRLSQILAFELPIVTFVVVISVATAAALPVAIIVIVLFFAVRIAQGFLAYGRIQIVQTPVDLSVLLLGATLPVTLWVTTLPEITTAQVLRLLTGVGLFYAIINRRELTCPRNTLRHAALIFSLIGAGLALASPFVVEWSGQSKLAFVPSTIYQHFHLLVSDGVNPNVMAGALVILSPIPLSVLLFDNPAPALLKLLYTALLVLMLVVLVLASSRGALAAFVLAAGALAILRWRRSIYVLGVVLSFLVLVAIWVNMSTPQDTVLSASSGNALSSATGRVEIWSRAIYIIQDFPFTGIGMGLFSTVTDMLYPMILNRRGIEHAHNLFLQVAVDLGIPGLIAWLSILIIVMVCLWQVIQLRNSSLRPLAAGLFASQVALVVHGLTDAVTWGMVRSAPLVWALWGLAIGAWIATKSYGTCKSD